MKKTTNPEKLATLYIISKGRPHCTTAQTLVKMNYPGEWFIVCGNNDETLPQYIERWGEAKVLVFDWFEQVKHTDVLDNFGFEKMASGAAPVRNAVFDFSRARGEKRHWQMDDDFTHFRLADMEKNRNIKMTGELFYKWLVRLAQYADDAHLANIGFSLSEECFPVTAKKIKQRVYAAHNMSNDPAITPEWRSRFNDDTIHAIDVHRLGQRKEIQVCFMAIDTKMTQSEKGGLTDMYKNLGTVRKTAYLILLAPSAAKLTIRHSRYHHIVVWKKLVVKMLSEKWRKE